MKLDRKGFTLVELLVTIAIIALVVGFSVFGIINVINNSEEEATVLSESNIKEAASLYSNEMGSSSWKKTNNYDAFCVTVGELMNKGLLDKNGVITEKNITKDTYIIIKRNNVTMAIESEEIVSSNINDDNNKVCTGQIVIDKENFDRPILGTNVSYTDKIEIPFTSGSSDSGVSSYKCLYGQSSSNVNKEGTIDGNKCVISNLKHNTNYYVLIYMNTNKGSSVLATGENNYSTSDFKETTITQNKNIITIKYSDKDTNGNNINNPSYYFKSTINGTVDNNIEVCTLEEDKYTCTSSTREIKENTWYKVSKEVKITYPEENNKVTIDTRIYDGSNNYRTGSKDFEINKYIVKFYKNSAQGIGGSTDTYITRYCIAGKNETCSITSPSIEAPTGYTVVGWNTSKNGKSSSWNVNTSKDINSNLEYYAIVKKEVTITFNSNGATVGSSSQSCTMWNSDASCSIISPTITRSGFTITGWGTSADDTTNDWTVNTSKNVSGNAIYYAITSKVVTISFNGNGATAGSSSQSCTIQNNNTSCSVTSPTITRSGFTITGWGTSADDTTNDWTVNTAKNVSSNATYYAITSKGITISFNGNGATAGSSSQSCTIQNNNTSCSVTSPTITRSGFTITGWGTSAGDTTNDWKVNTSKSVSSNATYYAITSKTVTITFDKNGATSIGSTSESCTIQNNNTSCSVTSPTITREGYTITGWNTSRTATTSTWSVDTSKSVSSNATYYAITKIKTYYVYYNANGGSGAPSTQSKTHGQTLTLSSTKPTKTNYSFLGWATTTPANTVAAKPGGKYSSNATITLYAVWQAYEYGYGDGSCPLGNVSTSNTGTDIRTPYYSETYKSKGFSGYYCQLQSILYPEDPPSKYDAPYGLDGFWSSSYCEEYLAYNGVTFIPSRNYDSSNDSSKKYCKYEASTVRITNYCYYCPATAAYSWGSTSPSATCYSGSWQKLDKNKAGCTSSSSGGGGGSGTPGIAECPLGSICTTIK